MKVAFGKTGTSPSYPKEQVVIPAKAGIHLDFHPQSKMDSSLTSSAVESRWDDEQRSKALPVSEQSTSQASSREKQE
jgi:hypothetical protein